MLTATAYFNAITRNYSQSLARTAAESTVARQTKYYLDNIGKVKSVDDLLNNDKLYTFVMTAFGLGDMLNAKGLVRKVLEGGIASPASLANTLNDTRYRALAYTFDFAANGAATTSTTAAQQGTVDKFIEMTLETDAGKQNDGTRMALYFQRVAPSITSTYGLLADPTLLKMVQTAFGLSPRMSLQPIDTQAKELSQHLRVADLQDPAKLQKIIERFTANYDAQRSQADPGLTVFGTGSGGISPDLLSSLANLKLGGF